MTLRKHARLLFAFSFAALLGGAVFESEAQAQHFRQRRPGQELGRFLGVGFGNGYHCRTPGPNTDYYNPYSAQNSHLVSSYQLGGAQNNMYTGSQGSGNFGQRSVPHSIYTGTQSDGFSVFESVPGQTITPSFEPVPDRKSAVQRDAETRNFADELDLESDQETDSRGAGLTDSQDSPVNRENSDGDFEALRDSFED